MTKKKPLIIIAGPTAVGKTKISIDLARAVNGEIISADSMQVYKHMDVGSAKIHPDEMRGIKHHLIDVLEPSGTFSVALFKQMAKKAIEEIHAANKIPVLTGGTGFYIQAVLYDIDFKEHDSSFALRRKLEQEAAKKGSSYLHKMLAEADPKAAEAIHPNNVKRIIRALEYHYMTGEKISEHNASQREKKSPYEFRYFVLNDERKMVYEAIDLRVDRMIHDGLIEEVRYLKNHGCTSEMTSMQGLGYREIMDYLDGKRTLSETILLIKQNTRHFAKRQLTWFRREKDVIWIEKNEYGRDDKRILNAMLEKTRGMTQYQDQPV